MTLKPKVKRAPPTAVIEVYQGIAGPVEVPGTQWYWRLRAPNNKVVADGAEGYAKRANARRAARTTITLMAKAVFAEAK